MKRRILSLILCLLTIGSPAWTLAQGKKKAAAQKKSSPEAVQFFSRIAKVQNNGDWEIAAEDWGKFIKRHQKDPLVNRARHYLGVCHMQLKDYQKAVNAFDQVRKDTAKDKTFKLRQDTLLNLGWCQYTLAESNPKKHFASYGTAIKTLSELIDKHPKSRYTDQALYFRGESLYLTNKKLEAIKDYRRLATKFTKSPLRGDTLYALGVTYEELADYKAAGAAYDEFIKGHSKNQFYNEVRMRKAETVLQQALAVERKKGLGSAKSDLKRAGELFAAVARTPRFGSADHALIRQGFALRRQNRFLDAAAVYQQLISTYPKSRYQREAKLSLGRSYLSANQLKDAKKWLSQVSDGSDTIAAESIHWLCRVHIQERMPRAAIAAARTAITRFGKTKLGKTALMVNLRMDLADALYETKQGKTPAIDQYKQVASESPRHEQAPQALYNAAFGEMELSHHKAALQLVQQFERTYSTHKLLADAKYVGAESLLQLNRFDEALEAFQKLITTNPKHPQRSQWRIRYGAAHYIAKKYDPALELLTELSQSLSVKSQLAEVHFLRGACNFAKQDFKAAALCFRSSMLSDSLWTRADENLLFLARTQRKLNKLGQARDTARAILEQFKTSKITDQVHYRLGEFAYAAKDYKTSLRRYDTVLNKFPKSRFIAFAQYGKAWSQLKSKDYKNALASFETFIADYPQHKLAQEALFARGMARRGAGDHNKALTDLKAFLATEPKGNAKSDAVYEMGLAHVGLKKYRQAIVSFKSILKDNPRYPTAALVLYETAWAHKSLNEPQEAVKFFDQLAAQYESHKLAGEAHFHVGEFHYDNKRYDISVDHYQKCWDVSEGKPLGEKAVYKLAWSQYQLGKYTLAQAAFRQQLKHYGKGALRTDGAFMEAECFFKQRKYKEALAAYTQSKDSVLGDDTASVDVKSLVLLHAAQCAAQLTKWKQSSTLLDDLLTKFKRGPYVAEANYEQGWAQQNLKNYKTALERYEEAATLGRGELVVRSRFMAGEVLFEQKQYNPAIRQFRRGMLAFGANATKAIKNWQSKCGFEAARCAEVQIRTTTNATQRAKLIADAIKYYKYVVDQHPNTKMLVAKAKQRLKVLNKFSKR